MKTLTKSQPRAIITRKPIFAITFDRKFIDEIPVIFYIYNTMLRCLISKTCTLSVYTTIQKILQIVHHRKEFNYI